MNPISALVNVAVTLRDGFLYPGQRAVQLLDATFPNLQQWAAGTNAYDLLPVLLSLLSWLVVAMLLRLLWRRLRTVLRGLDDEFAAMRLRLRLFAVRLSQPVRRAFDFARSVGQPEDVMASSIELDKVDVAVLRIATARPPGLGICALELVEHLHCKPSVIQGRLDRLAAFKLLENDTGLTEGRANYRLTAAGTRFVRSFA